MAARCALCVAAAKRGGRRRYPSMRGGVRRGPVRRVQPEGEDEDVELLQLVLLLHGLVDAGGGDSDRVCAGQHRLGVGAGNPHRGHGSVSGVVRSWV